MMKANEVIRIGRSRSRQASWVASKRGMPDWCFALANSTMRIAFLLASPTRTTKPIWVKMLMSMPASATPATEQRMHIGTTRITASGRDQLSYCPASTRNTSTTAPPKTNIVVCPAMSWRYITSVQSNPIERGSCSFARRSIVAITCPVLMPGTDEPLIEAAGYML